MIGVTFIHFLAWLGLAAFLALLIKRAYAEYPRTARIIIAGALLRLLIGVVSFVVSAYELPLLRSLHDEPGFWVVAPDAKHYFRSAVLVAEQGVGAIPWDYGSPTYIVLLSAWMHLVGFTPVAGFLLNLSAYVVLAVGITWRLKTDRLSVLPVAILSFSPVLLIHGSQPLKDEVFVALIGISLIALSVVLPRLVAYSDSRLGFATACACLVGSVAIMTGIRPYYAFEICAVITSSLLLQFLLQPGPSRRSYTVKAASLLLALFAGFHVGGGKYFYQEYQPRALVVQGITSLPAAVGTKLADKRAGFVRTGGETSLVQSRPAPPSVGKAAPKPRSGGKAPPEPPSVDQAPIVGMLAGAITLFVPMTMLQAAGLFSLSGGRGLLFITDLDAIYMDATIVLTLVLALRSRPAREGWVLAYTMIALALLTVLLMGYVVTNFGTLFRLRTLIATPLWLLPIAVAENTLSRRAVQRGATAVV